MARFTRRRACPSDSPSWSGSRVWQQSDARPTNIYRRTSNRIQANHLLKTERIRIHAEDFCMWELWNGSPPPDAAAKLPVVRTATYWTISRETSRQRAAWRRARPAGSGHRSATPAERHGAALGPSSTRRSTTAGCTSAGRVDTARARTSHASARCACRCNPASPSDANSGSTGPTDSSGSATNATGHAGAIRARAARGSDSSDRRPGGPCAAHATGAGRAGGVSPYTARTDRAGYASGNTACV